METLRDTALRLVVDADKSPLAEVRREMTVTQRQARSMGREVAGMGSSYVRAHREMINESQAFTKQVNRQSDLISTLAKTAGTSATQLAADWKDMSVEMRQSMIRNHNDMRKFRKELLVVENDMWKLGRQMGHYAGSTNDFMQEVNKLGKTHKKISDQMINTNQSLRQGFIQTVATMSAMSGQSEKISANYDRMGKAIYLVNKPLLAITSNLERMARQGNAANLALQMLGPNASMKELQDQTRLITQGVMRQQEVLRIAGIAWLGFTAILAHAAYGPDPERIRERQDEITQIYKDALNKRTAEIRNAIGLFEFFSPAKVKPDALMAALDRQLNVVKIWSKNLQTLTNRGVDQGLIAELQKAGPRSAAEIQALTKMSETELQKYVAKWRELHATARNQAVTELAKLKQETDAKIKELQDSLTPLGLAWEKFKSTWADALKPFVDLWGQLATGLVTAGTKVGEFVQHLNSVSPWITKLAGMFIYLVTTFTLLLAPLAVGIGYFFGLKAAFTAAWTVIAPFVTGLGAMMGTVLLVSGAVLGLGVALYLLWTRSETFRNTVINGWEAIKTKAQEVWGFISLYINQAIGAIVQFGQEKLAQLRAFWQENGSQILQAVKNFFTPIGFVIKTVMGAVWSVMKFVWPAVLLLIKSVWGNIKGVINGALNIIMGAVKIFSGLFTGDFSKMWEGIKQVFFGAIQFIWNFIQLTMFGKILGAGKAFVLSFKSLLVSMWTGIRTGFIKGISAIKTGFVNGFNFLRKTSNAVFQGITTGAINFVSGIIKWFVLMYNRTRITFGILRAYGEGIFRALWNTIRSIVTNIAGSVRQGFTTMKDRATGLMDTLKSNVTNRFNAIVDAAKALPERIGKGIKSMAGKALSGVKHLSNSLVAGLAQGINGVTGGINWVLGKIGVDSKIPKWEPPQYARGTSFHPGGPAILGDGGGSELYRTPAGQIGLSPARDTLMNLPRGTEVLPAKETRVLLKSGMLPAYNSGAKGEKGNNLLSNAVNWVSDKASSAWEGTKHIAGKVKDIGLDVWSYLSNPSDLMKKVYEKFIPKMPSINGVFGNMLSGSMNMIKDKAIGFVKKKLADFANIGGNFKGGVASASQVRAWITQALAITNTPMSWLQPLMTKAYKESTFNPRAINLWDSNYRRGTPSKGLLQTIDPTFNAYKLPGMNDIYNPVHNAVAAIRYIKDRYGSIFETPGIKSMMRGGPYKGYATGGIATRPQLATLAENGWKEFIIPTEPRMRSHALSLLGQANRELGYSPRNSSNSESGYTPSGGVSNSSGQPIHIEYNPTVHITIPRGSGDSDSEQKIKKAVDEALDAQYQKLLSLFKSGVKV